MPNSHNPSIVEALRRDNTVDISTLGRRSGRWRRLEIWFHNIDGHIYLTGIPRPRDWYANLLACGDMVFHLKQSIQADLQARGRPVEDAEERRRVLTSPQLTWYHSRSKSRAAFIAEAPLVEVVFTQLPDGG